MKKTTLRLPHVLRLVFDAAGIEAVIGLARALGGKTIYCPVKLTDGHPLVAAAGRAGAEALLKEFSGQLLHIPQGIPRRNLAAIDALNKGLALNDVVTVAGVNIRTVSRIKAALKAGSAQTWEDGRSAPKPAPNDPRQMTIDDYLK